MKKTLAIVLALVMVLAMIPAMSAATTETITDKSYTLTVSSVDAAYTKLGEAANTNTVTAKYNFETEVADVTGKFEADEKVAIVTVQGFKAMAHQVTSITIDGKVLKVDDDAAYAGVVGAVADNTVNFPVVLTKAGYTDTYLVTVVSTDGTVETTETAKISVKMVNTASYKASETAVITNIVSTNADGFDAASAYIVGDKIYVDFVEPNVDYAQIKLTFAKANGAAFSEITYAQQPGIKLADGSYAKDLYAINANGKAEDKLDKSTMKYNLGDDAVNGKTIRFTLETKDANYATKDYTVKVRYGITEEDPKGIYFAETTKTIAMGEKYSPVVVGVKTGKPVAAKLALGDKTDAEVIDLIDNNTTVIGTREGVAYITAKYTTNAAGKTEYTSSSMKIIVTLPGESIPEVEPSAEIYYVTCRALNVRAGAGTSYKKVDLIHRGEAVKVVELKNGWAKLDDGTYVCAKYIAK